MRKFKKVKIRGQIADQLELIKDTSNAQSKHLHPAISHSFYNANQAIKRFHIYVLIFVAVFIAIFGLFIIDSQFQPIQTPNEVYSKLTNLNHSSTLMGIIIFWMECIRAHKLPIYR